MGRTVVERFGLPRMRGAGPLLTALLIDAIGTGLFAPFALLYFHEVVGLPLRQVGVALTAATALTVAFSPLTGALVDRIGARRMVVFSQLMQSLGLALYFLVERPLVLFFAALPVMGGLRMFWTAFPALVADIAAPAERDRWYGLTGSFQNAGAGIGGLIAGLVVAFGGDGGYRALVVANACTFLLAALLLQFRLPDPVAARGVRTESGGYREVLRDRPFVGFAVANIVFALCSVMVTIAIPVYSVDVLDAPAWVVGAVFALNTVLLAGFQTMVVRWLEPRRRTRALALAGLIWAASAGVYVLALGVPPALLVPYLFFAIAVFTFGQLIHGPIGNALAAAAGPEGLRGRYIALAGISWGIAAALAPSLFTLLVTVHAALPWVVLAALALAAGAAMIGLEPHLPAAAVRVAPVPLDRSPAEAATVAARVRPTGDAA